MNNTQISKIDLNEICKQTLRMDWRKHVVRESI